MNFCWATIQVSDMEKSLSFYQDVIGLKINRRMQPMPGINIVFLGSGGTEIELIHNDKKTNFNYGKDISLGFTVESLDNMMEFLNSRNMPIHSGPFQPSPFIKFLYILDPDGLKIQFVENIKA
ncbi:MAG TPA: VOC family protein [Syntrophales bacterium]|nr:VOC family protein [Syntrophales bacterium]